MREAHEGQLEWLPDRRSGQTRGAGAVGASLTRSSTSVAHHYFDIE